MWGVGCPSARKVEASEGEARGRRAGAAKRRALAGLHFALLMVLLFKEPGTTHSRALGDRSARRNQQSMVVSNPANAGKLAVVYLVTDTQLKSSDRVSMLHASILLAEKHLLPATPAVFYAFTKRESMKAFHKALRPLLKAEPSHVQLREIPADSWVFPDAANESSLWHGHWGPSYRMMGDWRLDFMPRFAREMGHRYVMQLDDDSFITGPVGHNLVSLFDQHGYLLGVQRLLQDWPLVTWGLPELAKFFLLTHQVEPTTLFDHCNPQGMEGLFSSLDQKSLDADSEAAALGEMFDVPRHGGWDRTILNGNCVMISLDFWFRPMVQRFVQLCRSSGGSVMYRWNEQAVLGMTAQIFAGREQLHNLTFPYKHRMKYKDALRAGGIQP